MSLRMAVVRLSCSPHPPLLFPAVWSVYQYCCPIFRSLQCLCFLFFPSSYVYPFLVLFSLFMGKNWWISVHRLPRLLSPLPLPASCPFPTPCSSFPSICSHTATFHISTSKLSFNFINHGLSYSTHTHTYYNKPLNQASSNPCRSSPPFSSHPR